MTHWSEQDLDNYEKKQILSRHEKNKRPTKAETDLRIMQERIADKKKPLKPSSVKVASKQVRKNKIGVIKENKYKNKKVVVGTEIFDSKKEYNFWLKLKSDPTRYLYLERQKVFKIEINGQKICKYIADFYCYDLDDSEWKVFDVKSEYTKKMPVYRLKKKLMLACLNLTITEV